MVPETFDESVVDRMVPIDVDDGYEMSKLLASKGVFAGQSSGAYVQGAYDVAREVRVGTVVTILNDIGGAVFQHASVGVSAYSPRSNLPTQSRGEGRDATVCPEPVEEPFMVRQAHHESFICPIGTPS